MFIYGKVRLLYIYIKMVLFCCCTCVHRNYYPGKVPLDM